MGRAGSAAAGAKAGAGPPLPPAGPAPGDGLSLAMGLAPGPMAVKKMRKRRELDALAKQRCPAASNGVHKRSCSGASGGGLSSHDQLLSDSSGDDSARGALPLPLQACKPGYAHALGLPLGHAGYTPGLAVKRRRPGRAPSRQRPLASAVRACVGLLVLGCVIATLTIMWLFFDVRQQVFSLRTEIEQVVAGSQGVPDDLQKIHSVSRELQQNQTQLSLRVNTVLAQVANLTSQLITVQKNLRAYSDQVQSHPEPSNVNELMSNVARVGSQIQDLDNTVRSIKQHQASLDSITQTLGQNLTALVVTLSQLANTSVHPPPLDNNIGHSLDNLHQVLLETSANITEANTTLTKRLQWLQDDQVKDHKAIEALQDLGQNFTARLKTLEGECAKVDKQNSINASLSVLKEKVALDSQRLKSVERTVSSLLPSTIPITQSSISVVKPPSDLEDAKTTGSSSPALTESGGVISSTAA